jgi:hypothetical protein
MAQIEALRVLSFEQRIDKSQIEQAMSQLDSSDKNVSRNALDFLLGAEINDFQLIMRVTSKLVELASSSNMEIRQHIGSRCNIICNTNPGLALTLTILSESKDVAFLNNIKSNLGSIESNYPIKCLEIIQRWFRTNVLRSGVRICGILQQIAKGDVDKINDFLRLWIAEEKNNVILMFRLPTLLRDMFYWSDKKRLVDLLASTDLDDERQLRVVCRTLNMVLCDLENDPRQRKEDFVGKCFNFVSTLAASKDIDITKIVEPGEQDEVIRILAIVDSIEKSKRNVDFNTVNNNLNCFQHIKELFSQSPWLGRAINRKDASHPLISLLEMKKPDDSALLKYIDNALALFIKDKNARLGGIRNGFEAASQFSSTVQELVVCAHFKSSFETTEIQFPVGGKVPDCKVNIDRTQILVEIKSLDLPSQLKYCTTMVGMEGNRLKEGIKKKLEKQIPAISAATNMPIFIAVDTTRAKDIDEIDIIALFLGTMQFELERDPQGQIIRVFPSRAKDSIAHKEKRRAS